MFECMDCGEEYFVEPDECEICGKDRIIGVCPTCEMPRDEMEYFPEYDTMCHDCVVLQPKMEELGVNEVSTAAISKDDISMEAIYEVSTYAAMKSGLTVRNG